MQHQSSDETAAQTLPDARPGLPLDSSPQIEQDSHPFARYLSHFRDAEPVGIRCAPTACPLARYLASKGVAAPVITDGQYGHFISGVTLFDAGAVRMGDPHFLPEWAITFVELIDENSSPSAIVTAAEARQALRNAITLVQRGESSTAESSTAESSTKRRSRTHADHLSQS